MARPEEGEMNVPLLVAAALAVALAAAHSYLGERYILIRLFRRNDLPKLFGGADFTKRTLRLAWHITTVLAFGFGALLAVLATGDAAPYTEARIISAACALSGLLALVISRGRHLSWIVFFTIAALAWIGSR
jgi:hypothetical protein